MRQAKALGTAAQATKLADWTRKTRERVYMSADAVLAQRCFLSVVRCVQQLFASVRDGSTRETVRVSIRKA